jgi:hypothetical protein
MVCHRKLTQDVAQVPWANLCCSARRLYVFGKSDTIF